MDTSAIGGRKRKEGLVITANVSGHGTNKGFLASWTGAQDIDKDMLTLIIENAVNDKVVGSKAGKRYFAHSRGCKDTSNWAKLHWFNGYSFSVGYYFSSASHAFRR